MQLMFFFLIPHCRDVSVSPLKSADAKTLVEKLTPSLAGKLVVVFMQDEVICTSSNILIFSITHTVLCSSLL